MASNIAVRWLKWLLLLVVLGGGAGYGYLYWQKLPKAGPDYRTVIVTRGDLTQVVTATGTLNPVTNVQVGSQISGMIQKLYADFNSTVTNGQIVAQIDPATFRASLHQCEGDLADAQAGLELAQVNFKRDSALVAQKLIAQSDFDKTAALLHQAEAQVKIREAVLEKSKVDLARTTIFAPIDGVVISRSVDVGQTVAASFNTPTIFQIANDLAKMQIDANVSEADVGGVEVGQEVTFTVDAFINRTFHGKVSQVRNAAITVQNVVTYDTVVEVNNADLKLKPGMTANISITVAHRENVLKVPNAALRFRPPESGDAKKAGAGVAGAGIAGTGGSPAMAAARGQGGRGGGQRPGGAGPGGRPRSERQVMRTVYQLAANDSATNTTGTLQPVQVKVGISDGISTEILEGLKEGEEVVAGNSLPESSATMRPAASPFGGGGFRRF